MRERWFENTGEFPADLDVKCAMVEGESPSITAEAEQEATKVIGNLRELGAKMRRCGDVATGLPPGPGARREDAAMWHGAPAWYGCEGEEDSPPIDGASSSEDGELRVGREAAAWPDNRELARLVDEEHLKALLDKRR